MVQFFLNPELNISSNLKSYPFVQISAPPPQKYQVRKDFAKSWI